MRSRIKIVLVLVLVAAIIFGSAGMLFARDGRETIEVFYRNIKLKVHGVDVPVSADNEPFIYQGRTYVPLRVVSEALGYDVEWDGATFTVLIGEVPGEAFLSELKPYHLENIRSAQLKYDTAANMVMDGQRHHNGIQISRALNTDFFGKRYPGELLFNLDAKYSRLTGLVGLDDNTQRNFTSLVVSFYGDDRLLTTVDLKKEQPKPTSVAINVTGVLVLKIVVYGESSYIYDELINLANMALIK